MEERATFFALSLSCRCRLVQKEMGMFMTIKKSDIMIIGFALFAIFFGAGNLIFPPYLGFIGGKDWLTAALGFLASDPLFPILGVLVTIMLGGKVNDLGKQIHPLFGTVLAGISIVLIGPIFSVPRTGATTHEIFTQMLFPSCPIWVTSLIFFGLTAYLSLNPSQVINHIGKYLTPLILILLGILGISAFLRHTPVVASKSLDHIFAYGFQQGYQTMDTLAAPLLASVVMMDIKQRGYKDKDSQVKVGIWMGIVALLLLSLVYLTLSYAGSLVAGQLPAHSDRTAVFTATISLLLGQSGQILMGICVALACLTTAVGITSVFSNFFVIIFKNKLSYQFLTLVAVAVEFCISLIGVEKIITLAVSVLTAIHPIMMSLILISLFSRYLTTRAPYLAGVIGASLIGIMEALAIIWPSFTKSSLYSLVESLPLSKQGLSWLVPTLLFALMAIILEGLYQQFSKKEAVSKKLVENDN
ncbi:branched-chain amino acid transport system II carrier protein [Atopobacter sp. AH10]|uniref:branched-chain amino acid transport system II carrier protein n=1 Tax=Atopobacter sp. AH10 TaxID=2315861 RepID=UPI001F1BB68E|nr:branched-chain amino acid transport system II carrier protein [Atopobacter sp. AH10]